MEKLILIDGNSLINRAFYAMPLLTTKNGIFTNAVYGFLNMFLKLVAEEKPTDALVAFDVHAPTFRHNLFSPYKGTRKPMPEELRPQIPLLKEVLSLMGICIVEKAGLEADDIIGTFAKHSPMQTIIVTGDKDSFQLVDKKTSIYFTRRGITDIDIYNDQNFKEKTGINPLQIIDLKSLMGDASDNIPGIAGIGEKTALSLIQKYASSENLYQNIDDFSGKLKEKIIAGKDLCFLSKTLATINTNADIDIDFSKTKFSPIFSQLVKQKFIDLELKSLSKRDDLFVGEKIKENIATIKTQEITDLSIIDNLSFENNSAFVFLNDRIDIFSNNTEYTIKLQTTLLDVGFSPFNAINAIKSIFTGKTKLIVFDSKDLRHKLKSITDCEITCPIEDVSIIKYLADFSGATDFDLILDEYGEDKSTPAYALYNIFVSLYKKLTEYDLLSLYQDVELPLSNVLYEMENSGFKIDETALYQTGEKYQTILKEKEQEIRKLADEPNLNINSPKQLGDILFEKLKIGKGKKTKNGYSTNAEILESLESSHPIVPLILSYRKIQKLFSTYIEGFKPLIDKKTGLIHSSFNQTVTATGRLSSKEPNLQNIPVRDDEGKELRRFFVPKSSERILIGADYSQIELRLLADFSNCEELIKAFKENKDIHRATASKVFKVPEKDVTSAMRSSAKAVNFGIIYGISEYGLAKNINTTNALAREYIDSYFAQYPKVKEYMADNVAFARENGYSITLLKRRRYIREITSSNYGLRQFGERVAMNMPLQGSAADIIKLAMLGVFNRLKKENLKSELILQIHDELIIDAFENEKEQVEKILKEEMENAVSLKVKLTVETGCGKTWFETK